MLKWLESEIDFEHDDPFSDTVNRLSLEKDMFEYDYFGERRPNPDYGSFVSEAMTRLDELEHLLVEKLKGSNLFACRVCGHDTYPTLPWNRDEPSYLECPCCGCMFGVDDQVFWDVRDFREAWINRGAPWKQEELKPQGWSLHEQLEQVPKDWRS